MGTAREYDVESRRGFSVITFEACLAECKWGDIERVGSELKNLLTSASQPFCLLDLSKLEFMGSSIVALLVRVWKTVKEQQGGMVVVNPNSMTKEVLEIAGLAKVWTICNSRPEAEQAIAKVIPVDSTMTGVLAAIIGWTIAGATIAVFLLRRNQAISLEPDVAQAIGSGGGALALLLNLLATFKGQSVWRAFGVFGVVIAGVLIWASATGQL